MWDEIQDMPGEIFDVVLDLEDFLDSIPDDIDLTDDGLESVTNFANWSWHLTPLISLVTL